MVLDIMVLPVCSRKYVGGEKEVRELSSGEVCGFKKK